jgi:hypothetical protein
MDSISGVPAGEPTNAIVQIAYRAPVIAVVDTASGTVSRVVVIDEAASLDPDEHAIQPWDNAREVNALDDDRKAAIIKRAEEIAEDSDASWPAWQVGW